MRSKTDFWVHLHLLANDLAREGGSVDEQAEQLTAVYESLNDSVRAVYGEDLEAVIKALATIALRCQVKRPE